jgi:hypothetical protein
MIRLAIKRFWHGRKSMLNTAELLALLNGVWIECLSEGPGAHRVWSGMGGEEIAEVIVNRFGLLRGRMIAVKVTAAGLQTTLDNLLAFWDMDGGHVARKSFNADGEFVLDVRRCPFLETSLAHGFDRTAYCSRIDAGICAGYSSRVYVRHERPAEGCVCRLIFGEVA